MQDDAPRAGEPEHGKFYWVIYAGPLPRPAGAKTIARFSRPPYGQAIRHGRWDVVANNCGFRFEDFRVIAGPIEAPQ